MPNASAILRPIAACATAPGAAGVAVIRLSGEGCFAVADRAVHSRVPPSKRETGTFFHTRITDPDTRDVLDDALVLIFRAPGSYTGEDTVEFHCHGNTVATDRVLRLLYRLGAVPAEPGEFTRRAFLNGRLDLTQAEAVCDVIHARSERAAATAQAQLAGALSRPIAALYDGVATLNAEIEYLLDFNEDELPPRFEESACARLDALAADVEALLATWKTGRLLREGARVVICGRPNAGKSSLMNLLVGFDRAIVSETAGTTRDVIEERFDLGGIPVRLIDTAGLRETQCAVEREGVARARSWIDRADAVLYVLDASLQLDSEEAAFIASLPKQSVVLANKSDLAAFPASGALPVSVLTRPGEAFAAIRVALTQALGAPEAVSGEIAVDQRHYAELSLADENLRAARERFTDGAMGWVPAAGHLREASEALGRILGRVWSGDMLDRIFSRFCVGK